MCGCPDSFKVIDGLELEYIMGIYRSDLTAKLPMETSCHKNKTFLGETECVCVWVEGGGVDGIM